MELWKIILVIAVQPILYFITIFIIEFTMYLHDEINHDIKKAKRNIKSAMWEFEWKWKLWKGDKRWQHTR